MRAAAMTRWLGLAAIGCYATHAAFHLLVNRPEDLLWACHLGALLAGVGLLVRSATINGVGVLFLCLGTPLWLLDLAAGGTFYPTSCFTHLGGLVLGLLGVRCLGMPLGTAGLAMVVLVALIPLCRWLTPPGANVNLAFAIHQGWERHFPSHPAYLATMMALASVYFLATEVVLRQCLGLVPARKAAP